MLLNDYLDDVLSWREAASLERHFEICRDCAQAYQEMATLKKLVRSLSRLDPPEDLALRVKIKVSKLNQPSIIERILSRLDSALRPIAIPAFSGVVLTFLFFVVLWSTFLPGASVIASDKDIPLNLFTEPRANPLYMSRLLQLEHFKSVTEPIPVEIQVGHDGRVVDYKILSGPQDLATIRNLNQFLYFELILSPATLFGRPTSGKLVLNLTFYPTTNDRIDVRP
jgi:Putative zinc-finger